MSKINSSVIYALIEKNQDNKTALNFILNSLMSFEQYHQAVFELECKSKLYSTNAIEIGDYQEMISSADKNRTLAHNNLLGAVSALNRLAEKNGLELFYDGIVSEERPYRREVANAVFDYMQTIIENRA